MIYKLDLTPLSPLASPPASGGSLAEIVQFVPWQPTAWPDAPPNTQEFAKVLQRIFEVSMLMEINNVIDDAHARTGSLQHRGHVVLLSLLCALDAISSYGYGARSGNQIPDFMREHFPGEYKPFADAILKLYRHASVHSWNLFEVAITPDNQSISVDGGVISFGLLNCFGALKDATENFLERLTREAKLEKMARERYDALRRTAKPASRTAKKLKSAAKT